MDYFTWTGHQKFFVSSPGYVVHVFNLSFLFLADGPSVQDDAARWRSPWHEHAPARPHADAATAQCSHLLCHARRSGTSRRSPSSDSATTTNAPTADAQAQRAVSDALSEHRHDLGVEQPIGSVGFTDLDADRPDFRSVRRWWRRSRGRG